VAHETCHAGEKSMQVLAKEGLLEFYEHLCIEQENQGEVWYHYSHTKGILDYVHTDVWGPSKNSFSLLMITLGKIGCTS